MAKRKRGKRTLDSVLQGRLQSQIAKAKYTGALKNMPISTQPPQPPRPELTDQDLSTMSDQLLKDLSSWAVQQGDRRLLERAERAMRSRSESPNRLESYGPGVTFRNSPTMVWTTGSNVFQTTNKPPRPTQKVGDVVSINQSMPQVGTAGTIGTVVRVGTRWVYVLFPHLMNPVRLSPDVLVETKKPNPPKVLDLSRVVMPDDHRDAIKEAVAQLEHNDKIFHDWGFDEVLEKGKAISMLFYGPPGTGKTMCAEIIAKTMGKKLEIIGTGEIQSSEPGQAERNIKAYFEKSGKETMLLFDECDSLVHSRNNTGSIMAAQINSLLTALERYEGIVIFTTNRLGVLDEAFNRRLSLKLHFPMPSREERLQIWKGMFPEKAPLDKNIKWDKLAALELTGGYIKNIVLRAARSAATQGLDTITYEVLKNAAIHEEMSKREFEEAARHHRQGGVTTINEAIQDFNQDNRLEISDAHSRTSTRPGKDQKK